MTERLLIEYPLIIEPPIEDSKMAFDFQGFQAVLEKQKEIESQKNQFRAGALEDVKQLVKMFNFTAAELGIAAPAAAAVPADKPKRVVKAKYRTADGFEWTGRGRMPKPIQAAIDAGFSLADMEIKD